MVTKLPVIKLGSLPKTSVVARAKETRKTLPLPLRIITSPRTTIALAGTLGALLFPATAGTIAKSLIPTSLKKVVVTGTVATVGAGVLASSPRARKVVSKATDPESLFTKGQAIGGLIEDPSKLLPKEKETLGGKIKEIAKSAGLIAGVGAVVAGTGVVVAKAVKGLLPKKVPSVALPTALLPSVPSFTPRTQPLGAVQKEVPLEKEIAVQPVSMPDIRITNKPQINISFRKSRRFINQQVLIKN